MLSMHRCVVVGHVVPLLCPHHVVVPVVHGGVFRHHVASVVGHVSTGWLWSCCLIVPCGCGHVVIMVCMAMGPCLSTEGAC